MVSGLVGWGGEGGAGFGFRQVAVARRPVDEKTDITAVTRNEIPGRFLVQFRYDVGGSQQKPAVTATDFEVAAGGFCPGIRFVQGKTDFFS